MANETRTWDARDLIITWGEIDLTDGVAQGSFLKAAFDVATVTKQTGATGHVTATVTANDGGTFTLTLAATSPTNDRLSAISSIQRRRGVGLIRKPMMVKHTNGTTLILGPETWIQKTSDSEFSADPTNREWIFDCAHMTLNFVGGSVR